MNGADGEPRTHNLRFTGPPLCQLSYVSKCGAAARARSARHSSNPPAPNDHIVKELRQGKKAPAGSNLPGLLFELSGRFDAFQNRRKDLTHGLTMDGLERVRADCPRVPKYGAREHLAGATQTGTNRLAASDMSAVAFHKARNYTLPAQD